MRARGLYPMCSPFGATYATTARCRPVRRIDAGWATMTPTRSSDDAGIRSDRPGGRVTGMRYAIPAVRHESTTMPGVRPWRPPPVATDRTLASGPPAVRTCPDPVRARARCGSVAGGILAMIAPADGGGSAIDVVLDAVNAAVVTIDADGIIIDVNQAASRLFDHPPEAMRGRNVSMLMPAVHAAHHDGYIARHLETGESRIIGIGRRMHGRRRDGSEFPLHLAIGRYEVDGRTRFTGILHDRSAEEAMALATTRLGRVLDQSSTEAYVFDADTLVFTLVSRGALANLGYTLDEMRRMSVLDLRGGLDRTGFERSVAALRSGARDRIDFTATIRRKDGTSYEAEVALNLSRAVSPPEFIALADDVTRRNRALAGKRELERMESIGQLGGGIAHDFNNLLTVIAGNLELLGTTLEPDDAYRRALLDDARHAAEMGARLTQRLLAFAERGPSLPERLDPNALVMSLGELLRRTLGSGIGLDTILLPGLWPTVVDRSGLENALVNLALNAGDAMPRGGKLSLETANVRMDATGAARLALEPGDYVTVGVADSGIGMSETLVGSVFEPFFTTKRDKRHAGLGLSTVYGFARQSGGTVEVHSEPGHGTTFTIWLPRAPATTDPPAHGTAERASPDAGGLRILVVEDEPAVRRLTLRRLAAMGHAAVEATDGPGALARWRDDGPFDAIVTDMVMPGGLTGLDVARAVRTAGDVATHIVMVTGYADERLEADVLRALDLRLVRKPFDNAELAAALADRTRRPARD